MNPETDRLVGRGWAWKIRDKRGNWALCNWAEPTKDALLKQGKPSPEAKPVWIKLTANTEVSEPPRKP